MTEMTNSEASDDNAHLVTIEAKAVGLTFADIFSILGSYLAANEV